MSFPSSLDSFTNPTPTNKLNNPSHSTQHSAMNTAMGAVQAKVGVDNSAVHTSLDWIAKTGPQAYLINGKIVPSVTSNNITVAIKGVDGTNPSATNPVYCRIGDTVRAITATLSITKNAGTNWFNSGGASFATYERDYFVYLGYNATDGVVVGFSLVPFANQYSDFSVTTTNEKYCAISTISNATSTDYYEVVGRFAATLSATASFNWSVPSFTAINLINRPIFETRRLSYLPTWTNLTVGNGIADSTYQQNYRRIYFDTLFQLGTTSSVGGAIAVSYPVTPVNYVATAANVPVLLGTGAVRDDSAAIVYPVNMAFNGTSNMILYTLNAAGTTALFATTGASAPFTWATTDGIGIHGWYQAA